MKNLKNGDSVKVSLKDKTLEGVLMPSVSKKTLFLKLKSGYNIGIDKNKIKKIKLVKKASKSRIKKEKLNVNKKLKNIAILHTGGTIASKVDYKTGGVNASFEPEDLIAMFPELKKIANIDSRIIRNMLSDDLRFKHFELIAKEIGVEAKKKVDGIIIGIGTDNLAVAASALSFILENINIPVILVGAQRSSDRGSSDAAVNLVSAAEFIRQSNFAGVAICMHEKPDDNDCSILPGCKTRKLHTSRRDAFRAVNEDIIAKVNFSTRKVHYISNFPVKNNKRKLKVRSKLEEKVGLLKVHVNMNPKQIEFFKGYKGLVIEGTGLGHMPIDTIDEYTKIHKRIKEALRKLIKNGTVVVMCSSCLFGRVNINVYAKGRDLQEMGVISGEDMLAETAFVKLAWLLANEKKDVKAFIGENLRGEINKRVNLDHYL
ncbi:Glu-tRNA(Gln) amidotransferase GatDE subunit D [archaeon]|nr:Glu-tRNA(Gln) amidotransferase GatDE subunit D [archaeon]